jgi:hypothetical protein
MTLSPPAAQAAEEAVRRILAELNAGSAAAGSAEKEAIS